MIVSGSRASAKVQASTRPERKIFPQGLSTQGISAFYGENLFDIMKADGLPSSVREEVGEVIRTPGKYISKKSATLIAQTVLEWALSKGATHFCHWFQPLTGTTAEKHDSFFSFDNDHNPIDKLSVNQLLQGEPDASSFPHGGSRSTFEARGYTSWDMSSPLFIVEGTNGRTLCIPTAFVSYYGDALDIKTPLLRSNSRLSILATKFLNMIGHTDATHVQVNCGSEQEYFLVDKAFYFLRPDLVMTGKTLFGSLTVRNQQLEDHYFGTIPDRVLSFMQELDYELYRLGIPSKTRHNEVAPGQFEMAPIFEHANLAADQNQQVMALIRKVAERHNFVALLHEKPFSGINGSGKHVNWSLSDNTGLNLFEPGDEPHENHRFLAVIAMALEAVRRHSGVIRASISGHGNDHRLGANEAPPSIMSVFLGDTITKIFDAILKGENFKPLDNNELDMGAHQLARLLKDNTDRNRTSPFAFTGNKFEFRAVGSSQAIGFPMSVLNGAFADVLHDSIQFLEKEIASGKAVGEALFDLTKKWVESAKHVIFNGDGYSKEWLKEAAKRGLPNYANTAEALAVLKDESQTKFLVEQGVYRPGELSTRYNVLLERYIKHREIEFGTFIQMINQHIVPAVVSYKRLLLKIVKNGKDVGIESKHEANLVGKLNKYLDELMEMTDELSSKIIHLDSEDYKTALTIAAGLQPHAEQMGMLCNGLEELIPDDLWNIPKYFDLLFVR